MYIIKLHQQHCGLLTHIFEILSGYDPTQSSFRKNLLRHADV